MDDDLPNAPDLVKGILHRDRAAESAFASLYEPRVRIMVLARTGDADLARDITQETLMAALVALREGRLRAAESLAAFVHGTARNLLNNHFRARSRSPEVPLATEDHPSTSSPPDHSERAGLVRKALEKLPLVDRKILLMILVDGQTPAEIAERLGLSPEVVRQRKCRAIRTVQDDIRRRTSPGALLAKIWKGRR